MRHHRLAILTSLAWPVATTAQITYVDADTSTNTTYAESTPYTPAATTSGTDDEWALRAFGNGLRVLTTHDVTGSTEDAPMLRTRITGLIPTFSYNVFSYHGSNGGAWRGRAVPAATQPTPPIQGYNTVHFAGSSFLPLQSLATGARRSR